jgi:hypothetical protein
VVVVVATLSVGPAVTAGTVEDAAAEVSPLDCPAGRHPISANEAARLHVSWNFVIN